MNEGGILSGCDCPCECATDSYTRWCLNCEVFHYKKIATQVRSEKEQQL